MENCRGTKNKAVCEDRESKLDFIKTASKGRLRLTSPDASKLEGKGLFGK